MQRFSQAAVLLMGMGIALQTWSQAQTKEGEKKPDEILEFESKREDAPPSPDFPKSFDSSATLGSRLVEARNAMDPVALAKIAAEIAANEKTSGKKASVTAEDLQKEAIDLAKLRMVSGELKSLAVLTKGGEKELTLLAAKAAKNEAAIKDGTDRRPLRYIKVTNKTKHRVEIYENGRRLGSVGPHSSELFQAAHLHHAGAEVHLFARNHVGDHWKSQTIHNTKHAEYRWTLLP